MNLIVLFALLAFQGIVFFALGRAFNQVSMLDLAGWGTLGIIALIMLWSIVQGIRDNTRAPDPHDLDKEAEEILRTLRNFRPKINWPEPPPTLRSINRDDTH